MAPPKYKNKGDNSKIGKEEKHVSSDLGLKTITRKRNRKSLSKVKCTPNFKLIHQRAFEKMTPITDVVQKKNRNHLLLPKKEFSTRRSTRSSLPFPSNPRKKACIKNLFPSESKQKAATGAITNHPKKTNTVIRPFLDKRTCAPKSPSPKKGSKQKAVTSAIKSNIRNTNRIVKPLDKKTRALKSPSPKKGPKQKAVTSAIKSNIKNANRIVKPSLDKKIHALKSPSPKKGSKQKAVTSAIKSNIKSTNRILKTSLNKKTALKSPSKKGSNQKTVIGAIKDNSKKTKKIVKLSLDSKSCAPKYVSPRKVSRRYTDPSLPVKAYPQKVILSKKTAKISGAQQKAALSMSKPIVESPKLRKTGKTVSQKTVSKKSGQPPASVKKSSEEKICKPHSDLKRPVKFDLTRSLSKKLNYKPYKGPLKPLQKNL